MDLTKYLDSQREAERLEREANKIEGSLSQLKKFLEEEFHCKSVKEAKQILLKRTAEIEDLESQYSQTLQEFRKKYPDLK